MSKVSVGDRISLDDEKATVRFVGAVPPTKGEWLGVEWDNHERGKHNGSKNGVQYFTCKHTTGGSFVREQKVNCGVPLLRGVKDRYTDDDDDEEQDFDSLTFANKKIEMIGMNSNHELERLKTVSLLNRDVSSPGAPGEISTVLSGVVELNLNGTLMSAWEDINSIISQLPRLKLIDLCRNKLRWRHGEDESKLQPGLSIETVILNRCELNWKQIVQVSRMWPNVRIFGASYNNIDDLEPPLPPGHFQQMEMLQVNGNKLQSWSKMKALNKLSRLESLQADGCGFSEVEMEEEDLPHLKSLSLNENEFVTPVLFNHLNRLSNLQHLYFMRNPINESKEYQDTILEIMVAKIAALEKVNNMKVTTQMRLDSELDYLRLYGAEWRNSGGHQDCGQNRPSEKFLQNHPTYMKLCDVHGAPQDIQIFKKTTALKSNLIELKIVDSVNSNFKPVTRKLPRSMKISSLKLLVQKLTKTSDMRHRRLVYVSKDDNTFVVELNRETETLHDVSIEPGDHIELRIKTDELPIPLPRTLFLRKTR